VVEQRRDCEGGSGNGKSYNDTLLNWISSMSLSMSIYRVWVEDTVSAMG
jgi:hypothetical protein